MVRSHIVCSLRFFTELAGAFSSRDAVKCHCEDNRILAASWRFCWNSGFLT